MEVPIELCTSAKVYRPDSRRRFFIFSLIVALYAWSLPYCYYTAGEPRKIAMEQAQKLADEKWALETSQGLHPIAENSTNANSTMEQTEFVVEYTTEATESTVNIFGEKISPKQVSEEFHDEFTDGLESTSSQSTPDNQQNNAAMQNYIMSWFGPSKEQKRAKAEFEKWQKELKEKSGETISLPPEYLPSAWACLCLFMTVTLHALFYLMGHWIVEFKASTLFYAAKKVEEGCFVLVVPPPNRGGSALVPVKKTVTTGVTSLYIEFQRQKYIYTPANKLGEQAKKYNNGIFTLSGYPVNYPINTYLEYSGIPSEGDVARLTEKWGKNHLAVAIPSFLELLQAQLLSPLAIFQVFCALLWLLDEYWSYTLFSLVSVVVYEATTVFQRTRTQQMLGGMAPKPTPIYVYRCNKWTLITSKDLLPGDIISLAFKKRAMNTPNLLPGDTKKNSTVTKNPKPDTSNTTEEKEESTPITSRSDIIPCDCLLLRGSAVVNEASLTGESVPQMKEAIAPVGEEKSSQTEGAIGEGEEDTDLKKDSEQRLDMMGVHRVHVLFSGCSLVTITGNNKKSDHELPENHDASQENGSIPTPPDHGAIAYVLRTGFGSSQGALLQMIEFSQQTVSGDAKETGLALLLLFIFALIAAGYVLNDGLIKKEKTTHELLLRCVIIITSVVPRQFPMQMAVAVNMALMALNKAGVFCTEPYRVPLAGKVSHCLFDKTGTITTDQLVPVGIVNYNTTTSTIGEDQDSSSNSGGATTEEEVSDISGKHPRVRELEPVTVACAETALILAACHSLVVLDEESSSNNNSNSSTSTSPEVQLPSSNLLGDPIELAAIRAIDWSWDGQTNIASPDGAVKRHLYGSQIARDQLSKLQAIPPEERNKNTYAKEVKKLEEEITTLESKAEQARKKAATAMFSTVQVMQRHHFSSALQRMSVVVRCSNRQSSTALVSTASKNNNNNTNKSSKQDQGSSSSSASADHWYCLVKGSPEAIKSLISTENLPIWYVDTYENLARRGLRVLALAYKQVSPKEKPAEQPRAWVESDLRFGGFIAFECKIRADSALVVQSLLDSDHRVSMLTGDALLTSLHVAKHVNICPKKKVNLMLDKITIEDNDNNNNSSTSDSQVVFVWSILDYLSADAKTPKTIPFDVNSIATLSEKYNLLTTEEKFLACIQHTGGKKSLLWKNCQYFKVFARMSPQGKANIIRAIQETDSDFHVFMCGDGGNDVGALKQADVGLALLGGHANANTSEELTTENSQTTTTNSNNNTTNSTINAEEILNEREKKLKVRSEQLNKLRAEHMKEFQAKYTRQQQAELQEEIKKRTERGEYMAMFTLMKEQAAKMKQAIAEENMRFMAMHGQVWDPKKDGDGLSGGQKTSIEQLMDSMDGADATGGLPMVRPGDASVAAPFTSRIPSIRAVIDLIRQGRCTLLSALMQQQIMMLESIISAYTLSSLSLHNARSSERQMMASSWLILTAAVSFSYATPVDQMHPLRPLRSLFHPAIILSIFGQAIIHIACMTLAVQWATTAMGPEKLQEVTEFFKKVKAHEIDRAAHCGEDDVMCQFQAYWMAPFMPNLLNSVVFLVETSQMISVFFANYKGRPWMKGMMENHPLFLSVFICIGGVIVAAWELVPQLNELIQLAPFPDDTFRYKVLCLVVATIIGTFLWDRFCVMIFAPKVFHATVEEARKTSLQDFLPILMTVGKVAAVIFILGTGNLLLAGAAFWWYRTYTQRQKEAEQQKLLQSS